MRFALTLVAAALAASSVGCSSDNEPVNRPATVNACAAAGGVCAANFPFRCAPGDEAATDNARKTACGKSIGENPVDVQCCLPAPEEDTGPRDTGTTDAGSDTAGAADAADATGADAATDVATDVADGG